MRLALIDEAAPFDHWQAASVMRRRLDVQEGRGLFPALLVFSVPEQPAAFRLTSHSPYQG
jgi:hypothetical protein